MPQLIDLGPVKKKEKSFEEWYAQKAKSLGLNPDPDDPRHHYDYRSAFRAGVEPDLTGHWPSKFKKPTHPRRYVGGVDTITRKKPDLIDLGPAPTSIMEAIGSLEPRPSDRRGEPTAQRRGMVSPTTTPEQLEKARIALSGKRIPEKRVPSQVIGQVRMPQREAGLPEPRMATTPRDIRPPQARPEQQADSLLKRYGKQLYNSFARIGENILASPLSPVGISDKDAEPYMIQAEFELQESGFRGGPAQRIRLVRQRAKQIAASQKVAKFGVEPAKKTSEKVSDIAAGLTAFIAQLALTRKFMPKGTSEPLIWEVQNQLAGGVPGEGAAMAGAFGAIGKIPAVSIPGKAAKVGAQSGLLAGITAAAGGDTEDMIIAALVPVAFGAYSSAKGKISDVKMVQSWRQKLPFSRDIPMKSSLKYAEAMRAAFNLSKTKDFRLKGKQYQQWHKRYGQSVDTFLKEAETAFTAAAGEGPVRPRGLLPEVAGIARPPARIAKPVAVQPRAAITPTKPAAVAPPEAKPVPPLRGAGPAEAREAWKMTRREWVEIAPWHPDPDKYALNKEMAKAGHTQLVHKAFREGKPIPREVLEEYKSEKWAQSALGRLKAEALAKPAEVEKKPTEPKEFEVEPGKFYTRAKIDEAITKGEMGEIEVEPILETESKSFNKHIDYFQSRQLPETSQIRKIQKQMQIVNGQRLAGTITAKEANKKIQQLRKLLFETAKKEGIALRMTKGGKVSVAVRKAGTYVPTEFAEYTKFKDISPVFGGGQDITRAVQQMDGSLTVKKKVKEKGQAGQLEQNVLWPTRDMSIQKLEWLKEKTVKLRSILNVRKGTKLDKQINLVLEKIASQDRNIPIKKILSNKTLKSMASPAVIKQAINLREFYDNLIDEQNTARKVRDQEEIAYRHKYSPHILRDATIWEQVMMKGKKAVDIFGSKTDLPDYIKPNKPFNPREMAREGGIPYEKRITSARELAEIYLVTAGKDIFNTSIIQNNKAFIQQLEAMGYKKSSNYLADWTAEAYAGVKPRLDRVVGLPVKAQKGALWFNRLRNMAVFPLNFAWNLVVQPSSAALTIGRYGAKNTLQGFLQWLVPSVRKQTSRDYYSYIIKASKQGKITKQDAQNLIGSDVKLKLTTGELIENIGGFLTNQLEKILTGTSIQAARIHGKKRGLTDEALRNYASDGGAKTQSMYNDEDKPGILRNLTVKTTAPYQTFAYEVVNTLREWAGRTGTPPDTKLYRLWTVVRFLAAASVFSIIGKRLAKREVWSWKRPPIPFAEFWLSPIIRIFSKEYIGGSGSGLTSPVETAQRVAKGIDDVLEAGNWRKLRNELIKYGPGIFGIPGGIQWSRTVDAIIAYSQGGLRDRRGRLLFKMEDPQDLVQAIFSGVWTTKGGREYIEKRTGESTKKQEKARRKRIERERTMLRR